MTECPACASQADFPTYVAAHEPVLKCQKCGSTFFARPIARPHDYGTYYPYLDEFDRPRFQWEISKRRKSVQFQLREIERLCPPGRTLVDFGAGPGYFPAIAREAGWNSFGIETSTPASEAGAREFDVRYTTLNQLKDGSCAVMTAFHVLEHLDSPAAVLKTMHRKLAHGGVLVVHVPNRESMSSLLRYVLRRLLRRPGGRYGSLYYPEHITGFTRGGLALCADRAGFDLIKMRNRSLWSRFYDPWLVRNFFFEIDGKPKRGGLLRLVRQSMSGLLDNIGSVCGRGDWLIAHFRAR
ncbi:MAG: class I SAM-dependent methyltransferase [Reyranella sp.]|nr:class I SAM-dependent methyltransferase [Reyranella sp.]